MFKTSRFAVLIVVVMSFFIGCGKPGDEYVGKWQNTRNASDQIEIIRNGSNFLVKKTSRGFAGKEHTTTVPATVKDGILQSQSGPITASLTYIKSTGKLTTPGLL